MKNSDHHKNRILQNLTYKDQKCKLIITGNPNVESMYKKYLEIKDKFSKKEKAILIIGEYFAKDLLDDLKIRVRSITNQLSAYLWHELRSLNPYTNLTSTEVDLGRFLRSIHELDYLLRHQPAETWLLDFIKKNSDELLSRLKEKRPGS